MKKYQARIVTAILAFFCLLQGSNLVIGWNKYLLLAMRIVFTFTIIFVFSYWGASLVTDEDEVNDGTKGYY